MQHGKNSFHIEALHTYFVVLGPFVWKVLLFLLLFFMDNSISFIALVKGTQDLFGYTVITFFFEDLN